MGYDLGFAVSVTGTLLSAAGFGFTYWQLKRTAGATEAANNAINSLRNRVKFYDHVTECARARKSLEYSITLLRLKQWQFALISLNDAQASLHRIKSSEACDSSSLEKFSSLSVDLLDKILEIEELIPKEIEPDVTDIIMSMRKCINLLDTESGLAARDM